MVKEFHIKTKKRKFVFQTITEMDSFIERNKRSLMDCYIDFIDENDKVIGKLKVSYHVGKKTK